MSKIDADAAFPILGAGALALLALCCVPVRAAAWGDVGHTIIGGIADVVLARDHPQIHPRVIELLDKRSLAEVAVLADCVRAPASCGSRLRGEERGYDRRNPRHSSYHFSEIPLQKPAHDPGTFGTRATDIVEMTAYVIARVRSAVGPQPRPNPPSPKLDVELTDAEALWLLVHLVGDLHQPLHVAAKYFSADCETSADPNAKSSGRDIATTLGANRIALAGSNEARNLHAFWDSAVVAGAMQGAGFSGPEGVVEFIRMLAANPPPAGETSGAPETWAAQWTVEVLPLAAQAHDLGRIRGRRGSAAFPSGGAPGCQWEIELDAAYVESAYAVARVQLAKAGHRLAALLKALLDP